MMNRKILFTAILMAAVVSISGCRDSKESGTAEQGTSAEKTKDRTERLSQNETDTEKSTDEVLIKETAKSAGEAMIMVCCAVQHFIPLITMTMEKGQRSPM